MLRPYESGFESRRESETTVTELKTSALGLVGDRGVGQVGKITVSDAAELGADNIRGETGAEEAAIERCDFALIERAPKMREPAFNPRANQRGFVGFGEDGLQGCVDGAAGNTARSQFTGDAKATLTAQFCVLIRVIERVAGVVEIFQLA